jgi:hypothetical protein
MRVGLFYGYATISSYRQPGFDGILVGRRTLATALSQLSPQNSCPPKAFVKSHERTNFLVLSAWRARRTKVIAESIKNFFTQTLSLFIEISQRWVRCLIDTADEAMFIGFLH